jgi:hypothetical protein
LNSRPDRGRPAHLWLAGPRRTAYIKERWGLGHSVRGSPEPPISPPTTLFSITREGRSQRREAPPPPSLDRASTPSLHCVNHSPLHRLPLHRPPPPVCTASPTNKMAGTSSSSNATALPSDGLHTPSTPLSLYLSDLVDHVLGTLNREM